MTKLGGAIAAVQPDETPVDRDDRTTDAHQRQAGAEGEVRGRSGDGASQPAPRGALVAGPARPAPRSAADYFHAQIPVPLMQTRRLTAVAKLVFGYVRSKQLMDGGRPQRLLAEWVADDVGCSPRACETALRKLVKAGLLDRRSARGLGRGKYQYATRWPDWLAREAGDSALTKEARHRLGVDRAAPRSVPRDEECGNRQNLPRAVRSSGRKCRDEPAEFAVVPKREDSENQLEGEPPEGRSKPRDGRRESRSGRKGQPPSGRELKRRPSRRWEFNRWRDHPPAAWDARDLVGYWASEHVKQRGVEDQELFAVSVAAKRGLLSSVDAHVGEWMAGDFAAAKEAVDLILEHAERQGMPTALRYFFLPQDQGPLPRLRRKVAGTPTNDRGRRPGSEAERIRRASDRDGSNVDEWRQLVARKQGDEVTGRASRG